MQISQHNSTTDCNINLGLHFTLKAARDFIHASDNLRIASLYLKTPFQQHHRHFADDVERFAEERFRRIIGLLKREVSQ